jgi:hypothetical protein
MKKIYRDRAKMKPMIETARIRQSRALPIRAQAIGQGLADMDSMFRRLFADENFITLLRAESMTKIPGRFDRVLKEVLHGYEVTQAGWR